MRNTREVSAYYLLRRQTTLSDSVRAPDHRDANRPL